VTDADGRAALTFDAPAIVSGRVFVAYSGMPSVAAHISAVLASDPVIPGHALVFDTDAAGSVNLGATSFRLALQPGSYNLFVTPTAPDLPPVVVPVTVMGDHVVDIVLPGMQDLFRVSGHIFDPYGQGVPQMTVQVEQNSRRVSTVAITDGGGGFNIVMPRAAGSYTLRAQPLASSTLVAPTLEQSLTLDGQASQIQPILRLPRYPGQPMRYHFNVQARSFAGLRAPVPGAQLAFTSTIPDPDTPATFSASATTDLLGGADVWLIPQVPYTIAIQTSP